MTMIFVIILPRILEIYALDESLTDQFIEPEIVLGKLEYARWSNWPPREQEAVRQYLTALWLSKINHDFPWEDFSVSSIEYWLCAIGQAEDDLEPYLTAGEAASSPAVVGNLSHWIVSVHDELAEKKLCSAFWKNRQVQCAQVVNWVLGKKIERSLSLTPREAFLPSVDKTGFRKPQTVDLNPRLLPGFVKCYRRRF